MTPGQEVTAIRGALVTFSGDPFVDGVAATRHIESDAIVAMAAGRIVDCGAAQDVSARLPPGTPVVSYANALITAGFIDGHVHYPADAGDRCRRQEPARLARGLHVSDGTPLRRCRARARSGQGVSRGKPAPRHHDRRGLWHRASFLGRCVFRRSLRTGIADDRRQSTDGSKCARRSHGHGAAGLRRFESAGRAMAWQRAACLCDHAALCGDVESRATRSRRGAQETVSGCLCPVASFRKQGRSRVGEEVVSRAQELHRRVCAFRTDGASDDLRPRNSSGRFRFSVFCTKRKPRSRIVRHPTTSWAAATST